MSKRSIDGTSHKLNEILAQSRADEKYCQSFNDAPPSRRSDRLYEATGIEPTPDFEEVHIYEHRQTRCAFGIDAGGTKCAAGMVRLDDGSVVARGRRLTRPERGGEAVLTDVIELAQSLKGAQSNWALIRHPSALAFVNWWRQMGRYAAMQRFAGWAFQLLTGFNVEHRCRYT